MQRLLFQRALAAAVLCLGGLALAADYKLKDGTTITGEPIAYDLKSVAIKNPEGKALPRVAWTNFTQEAIKEFAKHPKIRPFVELHIEEVAPPPGAEGAELNVPEVVVPKRVWKAPKEVEGKPVLPESPGLFAGMFTTGVGWFSLLVMYAGIIYAGFEVAVYRRRPKQLVMGLSAIPFVGFFAPIAFLALPEVKTAEETKPNAVAQAAAQQAAAAAAAKPEPKPELGKKKPGLAFGKKPDEAAHAPAAGGHKPIATAKPSAPAAAPPAAPVKAPAPPAAPKLEAVVYRRGETNINKRFIETKFAGFFKAVLGPAEKEMWVVWVTATGGEHWSKRIVSITQTDVTVNCPQEGGGTLDETIQIAGIQEIHLRPQEG